MAGDKGGTAMKKTAIREYETSRYLDSEEMIAEYLSACLDDPNPNVFLGALGEVAKARGVAQLAKETGLSRESLYKTFSGAKPRFETILKITNALGVPLSIKQSCGESVHQ
jgi:probable addiction module antidote protein